MGASNNKFCSADRLLPRCEPGDLIEFLHPSSTFNHWAVYVGDGYIIHVRHPWVKKEALTQAASGRLVRLNNDKHKILKYKPLRTEKIINTAYDQVGLDWYNVQFYGCEMFCIRCRYGIKVNVADLYRDVIAEPKDTPYAMCNPIVMYGHQQHETGPGEIDYPSYD